MAPKTAHTKHDDPIYSTIVVPLENMSDPFMESVLTPRFNQIFPAMDRAEAREISLELHIEESEVWEKAQLEYAAGSNVFANFNRVAERLGTTPEKVLLVYALKHIDGIVSWSKGNKTQREPIQGRIMDLRIYLALLHQMVVAYENKRLVSNPEALHEE